jgi:predicted secreted protein
MRSIHVIFSAALVALSLSAVACGGADEGATNADDTDSADYTAAKPVALTHADNKKTVHVKAGQKVALTLSQNASTGYMWMITDEGGLSKATQTTNPGDVHKPGSSGTDTFTWKTTGKSGKHTIKLILQRPWAELSPPADTFTVTLDIASSTPASKMCGGFAGIQCGATEFCSYTKIAACGAGDMSGTCQPLPDMCPMVIMPVCGCDGKTHNNSCEANRAHTSVASDGPCAHK